MRVAAVARPAGSAALTCRSDRWGAVVRRTGGFERETERRDDTITWDQRLGQPPPLYSVRLGRPPSPGSSHGKRSSKLWNHPADG